MAILDWIKEVPLSAVYKERLNESERAVAALAQESRDCKVKVAELEREKMELQARLEECEQDRRALNETIMEKRLPGHDGASFDAETGTWVDADSALHYCPKCRAGGTTSPMTNMERGWKCPVCNTYAPDPKRPEPPPRQYVDNRAAY